MTLEEYHKRAYEAGKTFKPESEDKNAPCYDNRFYKEFPCTTATMKAWWMGRASVGSDVPKWIKDGESA